MFQKEYPALMGKQSAYNILLIKFSLILFILTIFSHSSLEQDDSSYKASTTNAKAPFSRQESEFRANEALEAIKDWSSRFGRDIYYGTQEATCLRAMHDQFDPSKSDPVRRSNYKASIVSIDWTSKHGEIVRTVSNAMGWHRSSVEAIAKASEELAGNHTYDKNLRFEYIDVHRLHNIDDQDLGYSTDPTISTDQGIQPPLLPVNTEENGSTILSNNQEVGQLDSDGQLINGNSNESQPVEPLPNPSKLQHYLDQNSSMMQDLDSSESQVEWQTPIRYMKMTKHHNFDVLINTEESAVHVPVHLFPGDEPRMNGIAWSDQLTKIFRDNFVRNPKLTNQYFASQYGFLRLYPAQKWQIARTDPDLYDARMRPWYVAGASSRKDVVILIDSSGSMTGSRRDIAKGVVFEILDTLTDNDHFLIMKFSDTVKQVGVPSCKEMRMVRKSSGIPLKNTLFQQSYRTPKSDNQTDIDSLFLLPASGRNIRHIKSNFTIPTSGIANFSHALITAFEVLRNYQDSDNLGSQCNQAIMLITDGSPSDFEDVFNRYNYPNAPVRVFTYLIGREAGDVTHTKMMACHNRGYYTHVINLAEVRETVQQYIPVMARPLVLNGTHPVVWTPAYGELTYQILTDWVWESKRRDKARAILAAAGRGSPSNLGYLPDIRVTSDDGTVYSSEDENYEATLEEELEAIDLFGYNSNPDCFWQTRRNDLLTTVVQPVYDRKTESNITEKFLLKNIWTVKETLMRTAQILGVAAADMKINDIIALAPSHQLGANGYAIMLTNNGYVMHHPDLRSILEPFSSDPSERNMRVLKPFFSSLDFTQVEHILNSTSDSEFLALRKEAVAGLTGWRELITKRTIDCQKRVQSRRQSFYHKPIQQFPFSFMIAIPQPYGSHRVEAQIEIKSSSLPEKLTTYFTTSDFDIWTVHPEYEYCDGPSNNTVTTLLDIFQRIEAQKLDDLQWRPAESTKPPLFIPGKIVCDKDLVQSLVYDAVATFGFSENCSPPSPSAEFDLLGMFSVRFSFVATRSGLTRVRHYSEDINIKKEALAFSRKHSRAIDETYYSRTVDYNMLVNESATLIQVPFNTYDKIRDRLNKYEMHLNAGLDAESSSSSAGLESPSSLDEIQSGSSVKDMTVVERLQILTNNSIHIIATQSIIVNEGTQRAVAGVAGIFYDYASFVLRFFNSTNTRFRDGDPVGKSATCYTGDSFDKTCDKSRTIRCGSTNDTIDCLLVDNNGYIIVSEDLDFIGRNIKLYEPAIMRRLVSAKVFHEVNMTDYQSVCMTQEEKQQTSYGSSRLKLEGLVQLSSRLFNNLITVLSHFWTILITLSSLHGESASAQSVILNRQLQEKQSMHSLLPNKTYLRPCDKTQTLYETRAGSYPTATVEYYTSRCGCDSWFVHEQVPKTNLIMLIVDSSIECRLKCDAVYQSPLTDTFDVKFAMKSTAEQVCSMFDRESRLYRKRLEDCYSHHPDEEHIKLCGAANQSAPISLVLLTMTIFISILVLGFLTNPNRK